MANYPPGGGYPPGGAPPGGYGGPPPGGMGGPPMGGPPGGGYGPPPGGMGGPPMGGPPGGMGGPPMGGMPPGGMGGPPMGGMPPGGMGGPPMGGMPPGGMGGPPMGGMPPGGMGGPPMGGMPGGMGGPPMGGMPGGPMMGGPVAVSGGGSSKTKIIGGVIGGVVLAILVIVGLVYASGKSSLHIINNAGGGAITIYVDGEAVEKDVPFTAGEDSTKARSATIPAGKHKVEAKDASGKVLDTQTMDFDGFFATYLFAPAHSPKTCFVLQTDAYGASRVANPFTQLDPTRSLWKVPKSVDTWWRDNPDSVNLKKKQSGTTKTAMRQITCGDPMFQN